MFAETHGLALALVREGLVDGLRIDHPDGLADPAGYLERLRDGGAAHVWVEKILDPGEPLRDWPVEGTVGYEFLNDVAALFVDPAGEAPLTALWEELAGDARPFGEWAAEAKLEQARRTFAPDVELAAARCGPAPRGSRRRSPRCPSTAPTSATLPAPRGPARAARGGARRVARRARPRRSCTRFQQTTPPVMAKGVEDTAFYRYVRLLALNDVGGDPAAVASASTRSTPATRSAPRASRATCSSPPTHDTKRSGDVRARLGALAGVADGVGGRGAALARRCARRCARTARPTRSRSTRSSRRCWARWPIEPDRLCAYMEKAMREAQAQHELGRAGRRARGARARLLPRAATTTRRSARRSSRSRAGRARSASARAAPDRAEGSPSRACPTSTRATSSSRSRSSTPTTGARSTGSAARAARRAARRRRAGRAPTREAVPDPRAARAARAPARARSRRRLHAARRRAGRGRVPARRRGRGRPAGPRGRPDLELLALPDGDWRAADPGRRRHVLPGRGAGRTASWEAPTSAGRCGRRRRARRSSTLRPLPGSAGREPRPGVAGRERSALRPARVGSRSCASDDAWPLSPSVTGVASQPPRVLEWHVVLTSTAWCPALPRHDLARPWLSSNRRSAKALKRSFQLDVQDADQRQPPAGSTAPVPPLDAHTFILFQGRRREKCSALVGSAPRKRRLEAEIAQAL